MSNAKLKGRVQHLLNVATTAPEERQRIPALHALADMPSQQWDRLPPAKIALAIRLLGDSND